MRVIPNKNRQFTNCGQTVPASQIAEIGVNVKFTTMENRLQNSILTSSKSVSSVCGKVANQIGQNTSVRPIRASNPNTSNVRPVAMVLPEMSNTPLRVQSPDMIHLSEQIKQAKMRQMMQKQQLQNEQQRSQQNNVQRQFAKSLQTPVRISLKTPVRGSVTPNTVASLKAPQILPSSQKQPMQKLHMATPVPPIVHNTQTPMDIDTSDCTQDKGLQTGQPSSPQLDHDSSSTESVAYLQKTISDPANTIVQHQIKGNKAKMLVMLASGKQRLITFDIPKEECSVKDLLDQVDI